jgi:hypothetical protein
MLMIVFTRLSSEPLNFNPYCLIPNGYGGLTLEVRWLGCEADHSPPSNVEVKNARGYISTSAIMVW